MNLNKILSFLAIGLMVFTVSSCGGSSGGNGNTGQVSVKLTDAPTSDYHAVYVTISQIQVHRSGEAEGQWQTILSPNSTYNLLDLVNGKTQNLGIASLATGTYTQMRLILADTPDLDTNILGQAHPYANYLINASDEVIELKVPSGFKTGIKLVRTFTVESGRTVGLILDFDAGRSVVQAGNSGNWLLKPTIKILDTLNLASLSGMVTDQTQTALSGVTVSAQTYDASTNEIATVASTKTDEYGNYFMYLEPETYTIVATADGFATACRALTAAYDMDYTEDFTLTAASTIGLTVNLTLPSGSSTEAALLEFRQVSPLDPDTKITVAYESYSASGSYSVNLPAGTYAVVALFGDETITVSDVTGGTITVDFPAQ